MTKQYSDRQMKHESAEQEFFFPKHVPPVTIKARSRADAEKKLEELDNQK